MEAVYCRGLGRATRKPLPRMKSSAASSMRPLLGSAKRITIMNFLSTGEESASWGTDIYDNDMKFHESCPGDP